MYPISSSSASLRPSCSDVLKTLVPVGIVTAGAMLAMVGMFQIQGDSIALRDTSEALAFIQDLTELMGMILPH